MRSLLSVFALPVSLLVLVSQAAADARPPTAIKKLSPDASEKLFPEHLSFDSLPLLPWEKIVDGDDDAISQSNLTARFYHPAFERHYDDTEENVLRRAAEALTILQRRSSCPSGMNSCDYQGSPNKCCQDGTYCTDVPDTMVGHVACCPDGSTCGGGVGDCPSDAVTCPPDLGGGCCIAGYVCQGVGCVPSASATPTTTAKQTKTSTEQKPTKTTTEERTTEVTSTSEEPTTKPTRTTERVTETGTDTATGGAPYRPTTEPATTDDSSSQENCPTGFYGCLATHGGGCCQTDRDCETHSCPPQASTTLVSDGRTIVAPATDVPSNTATSTCAGGWFMCGKEGGPVAGCCPSGYDCGTASCFSAQASQTEQVQKEFPKEDGGAGMRVHGVVLSGVVVGALVFTMM